MRYGFEGLIFGGAYTWSGLIFRILRYLIHTGIVSNKHTVLAHDKNIIKEIKTTLSDSYRQSVVVPICTLH